MMRLLLPLMALVVLAACAPPPTSAVEDKSPDVKWVSKQTGTGASGEPVTDLRLIDSEQGSIMFQTSCTGSVSLDVEDASALASTLCWWAGGGTQFVAAESGSALIVKQRTVDEEGGFGEWEAETINQ